MTYQYLTVDMVNAAKANGGFIDQKMFKTAGKYGFDSLILTDASMQVVDKKKRINGPPVKLVSYGQRCFSYVAPSLWNALRDNIRQSSSLQNFKTHIKTHLFNKCYDSD